MTEGGFSISSWRDILTILLICGFTTSAFVWLMKLDFSAVHSAEDVSEIRARQDNVRERLLILEQQHDALKQHVLSIDRRVVELEEIYRQ